MPNTFNIMKMKQSYFFLTAICLFFISASRVEAQELVRTPHASMWMQAPATGSTQVAYQFAGEGKEIRLRWGMDTAWNDGNNVRRGAIHIGKENLTYGRLSFQPTDSVGDDLVLSSAQQRALQQRVNNFRAIGTTKVLLNADPYDPDKLAKYYYGKPKNWYNVIKATTIAAQNLGMTIEAIAPMNEPDYTYNGQGTKADFLAVVKLLRADPFFDDIRISAGNTLNTDGAAEWYNYMKPYVNEGNTHQLAGSFDNYAKFFTTVRADGNIATADELHNTMEAFVGAEYGLQNGIWWGFDGVCRGRYCQATSGGVRLGYGENRPNWTAGCVYRLPDGSVDAFLGSSERQGNPTNFEIVCLDRDVFYDGYGPVRTYSRNIPGGPAGSYGDVGERSNAECVIHITEGADVADGPIQDGVYYIMNTRTRKAMSTQSNAAAGANVMVTVQASSPRQDELWAVEAVPPTVGGDFSYFYLTNKQGDRLLDVKNSNLNNNGDIIAYPGGKGIIEQWHFIYAGGGDYFIQSRYSGLFLGTSSTSDRVTQQTFRANNRYLRWRLVPEGAKCETTAPAAPAGVKAVPQSASVLLSWEPNTEADLATYTILRGEATSASETGDNWKTIGHQITATQFVDNSCEAGKAYLYKILAVDKAGNRSKDSELVPAQTLNGQPSLVAHYSFDSSTLDNTENLFDAVPDGTLTYLTTATNCKEGAGSMALTKGRYVLLPHEVGNQREMTLSMWVRWYSGNANEHMLDFGCGPDQCYYLTPRNGSGRTEFVIKKGDEEQKVICTSGMAKSSWRHVAVTIAANESGKSSVRVYVNGELKGSSDDFTLTPADIRPGLCFLGRNQTGTSSTEGYFDDLRIYNYALSPEDVVAVMNGLPTGIAASPAATSSPVVATEYYTLDGLRRTSPSHGVFIEKQHRADGSVTTRKVVR